MNFVVVGTNHRHSPIEVREKISFPKKRLKDALRLLREKGVLQGAAILSTCNRVEIYASAADAREGIEWIKDFIARYHEADRQRLLPYLYIYEGREAMEHLFLVAGGLDSLVLGETQILGQVKNALSEAEDIDSVDGPLREIFYTALSFAKKIHVETELSVGKMSVGSVAVDFIKEKVDGGLQDKRILIIGVGKVTGLVLKYLRKEGADVLLVSNRTYEKAKELASHIGAHAVRFDELQQSLQQADVVISATASPHVIIRKEHIGQLVHRNLLIIDLAVPRDVDPRVQELEKVSLFCLDDLQTVINKNMEKKTARARRITGIVTAEVTRRWNEYTKSELEPVLLP